jgi:hypothetical protein
MDEMITSADAVRSENKANLLAPWLLFVTSVCVTVGLFMIPAFIIRPFSFQSARGLILAMAVRQTAPFWTLVSLGLSLLFAVVLWRRVSRWKKSALVAGLCLASAATVMSRIDYFEWMFHPMAAPGFISVSQAKVDPAEMVLAVRLGAEARAYPILEMGYHHIVNDVVSGVPIAVTY